MFALIGGQLEEYCESLPLRFIETLRSGGKWKIDNSKVLFAVVCNNTNNEGC